jgi:hypothetical protein
VWTRHESELSALAERQVALEILGRGCEAATAFITGDGEHSILQQLLYRAAMPIDKAPPDVL